MQEIYNSIAEIEGYLFSNLGNVYLTFTGGGTGNVAANAQIFINTISNAVTTVVVNEGGNYTTTPTITAITSTDGAATFTVTMGGRANRVSYETLVAMGSMTGDGDDTYFPDT